MQATHASNQNQYAARLFYSLLFFVLLLHIKVCTTQKEPVANMLGVK